MDTLLICAETERSVYAFTYTQDTWTQICSLTQGRTLLICNSNMWTCITRLILSYTKKQLMINTGMCLNGMDTELSYRSK
jgi:hypothetical protein